VHLFHKITNSFKKLLMIFLFENFILGNKYLNIYIYTQY